MLNINSFLYYYEGGRDKREVRKRQIEETCVPLQVFVEPKLFIRMLNTNSSSTIVERDSQKSTKEAPPPMISGLNWLRHPNCLIPFALFFGIELDAVVFAGNIIYLSIIIP